MYSAWIKQVLAPPIFEDEDKMRVASLLNIMLLIALPLAVIPGIAALTTTAKPIPGLIVVGLVVLLELSALALMHRGRVQVASLLLSLTLWGAITLVAFALGGIRTPSVSGYLVVILVAGFLLGGRVGLGFAALSVLAGLGMLYTEINDVLPPSSVPMTPVSAWATQTTLFFWAAVLLHLATRSLNDALEHARRHERALAEQNRELKRQDAALQESEERFRRLAENARDVIYRYRLSPTPGFEYVSPAVMDITGYSPEEHYADPELGFKLVHPDDRHLLEAALRSQTSPQGLSPAMRWVRKDGTVIWTEPLNVPIFDEAGNLVAIEGIARDITERKRMETALQRHLGELAAIYQAGQQLQQLYAPESLAQELIQVLEETLGYEYGAVLLVDDAGEGLIPFALSDQGQGPDFIAADKAYVASQGIGLGTGITGWVAQTGQAVRLGDVRQDPRYYAMRDGIRSELCVPMLAGERVIGVVNVETTKPNAYSESDQRVLETVASQIAVAVQNARLYEAVRAGREQLQRLHQQRVSAQEEERRWLSRELHDEAGQALTALKISLELLKADLPVEDSSLNQRLREAVALTDSTLEQLRALARDLHPPALDALGLDPTLEGFCQEFARRTQLSIDYDSDQVPLLSDTVDICLYRFLQEALTNVARHANASRVRVSLRCDAGTVSLSVEDNGQGGKPQVWLAPSGANQPQGLGLAGMQERLALLGGRLEIQSKPGRGTRLLARVPWEGQP